MGEWKGKGRTSNCLVNFQLSSHVEKERCPQEIMENWKRSKLQWDKTEGKNCEFNFGLESEVIIYKKYMS